METDATQAGSRRKDIGTVLVLVGALALVSSAGLALIPDDARRGAAVQDGEAVEPSGTNDRVLAELQQVTTYLALTGAATIVVGIALVRAGSNASGGPDRRSRRDGGGRSS